MIKKIFCFRDDSCLQRVRENKIFSYQIAFTLAEVLIVLGIIGLIADMTIPTLHHNIQKKVLEVQFKKMYSSINQALIQTKTQLGVNELVKTYANNYNPSTDIYEGADEFEKAFYKQLLVTGRQKYAKKPKNYTGSTNAYFYAIGTEQPQNILPDGSSIDATIWSGGINISFDVNGPLKPPNRAGHDIFVFRVDSKDNITPVQPKEGSYEDYLDGGLAGLPCSKNSSQSSNGIGCSYFALINKSPDDNTKGFWENLP